jgi:hypothetical protein
LCYSKKFHRLLNLIIYLRTIFTFFKI